MTQVTWSFAKAVAQQIGADPDVVYNFLTQWQPYEGANAAYNPLNTTQHMPGSSPLGGDPNQNNGNPVQEYTSEEQGAEATAKTLMNGAYPVILNALQTGNFNNVSGIEQNLRTWGTGNWASKLASGESSIQGSPTGTMTAAAAPNPTAGMTPDGQGHFWNSANGLYYNSDGSVYRNPDGTTYTGSLQSDGVGHYWYNGQWYNNDGSRYQAQPTVIQSGFGQGAPVIGVPSAASTPWTPPASWGVSAPTTQPTATPAAAPNPNLYAQNNPQDGKGHFLSPVDGLWHNNNDGSTYIDPTTGKPMAGGQPTAQKSLDVNTAGASQPYGNPSAPTDSRIGPAPSGNQQIAYGADTRTNGSIPYGNDNPTFPQTSSSSGSQGWLPTNGIHGGATVYPGAESGGSATATPAQGWNLLPSGPTVQTSTGDYTMPSSFNGANVSNNTSASASDLASVQAYYKSQGLPGYAFGTNGPAIPRFALGTVPPDPGGGATTPTNTPGFMNVPDPSQIVSAHSANPGTAQVPIGIYNAALSYGIDPLSLFMAYIQHPGLTPDQLVTASQQDAGAILTPEQQAALGQQAAATSASIANNQNSEATSAANNTASNATSAANNAASNATTQRGQDLSYQDAVAKTQQLYYDSNLKYQQAMATATTDQQKAQADAVHNAELAVIAQMNDTTQLQLGQQKNQVDQYNNELTHQAAMANAANTNNDTIAKLASSPVNSPALYFMQRGYAPDWNTLAQGGQLPQGQAWVPTNPMTAYTPVTPPVDFSKPLVNPYTSQVTPYAQQEAAFGNAQNPYITSAPQGGFQTGPANTGAPTTSASGSQPFDWNLVRGSETGVANQAIPTGATTWSGYTGGAGPSNTSDYSGWKVLGSSGQPLSGNIDPNTLITLQHMAYGGVTRATQFMAGDAASPNPSAGGAQPEIIQNPTGAPLSVIPNPQNVQAMLPQQADPTAQFNRVLMGLGKRALPRYALGTMDPASAVASAQSAYNSAGMSSAGLPTSDNSYAYSQPTPMPQLLAGMAGYGYPVTPSMYAASTGSNQAPNNFAYAFEHTAGGGNMMPSMQTLNHMSPTEQQYYQGYVQGPMGIDWNDLTNYLKTSTANLGSAADAKGTFS